MFINLLLTVFKLENINAVIHRNINLSNIAIIFNNYIQHKTNLLNGHLVTIKSRSNKRCIGFNVVQSWYHYSRLSMYERMCLYWLKIARRNLIFLIRSDTESAGRYSRSEVDGPSSRGRRKPRINLSRLFGRNKDKVSGADTDTMRTVVTVDDEKVTLFILRSR